MNDTYVECLVACKKNPMSSVGKYVLYGFAIACFVAGFRMGILLIVAAIFAGIAYFVTPMFDLEYEYLYLAKELSIDKVIAKERRKHAMTINLEQAEVIAPSNSHELDSYRNRTHKDKDFSSGYEDAKTYTIAFSDKEDFYLVKVELNDEVIAAIKQVMPRKVKEY